MARDENDSTEQIYLILNPKIPKSPISIVLLLLLPICFQIPNLSSSSSSIRCCPPLTHTKSIYMMMSGGANSSQRSHTPSSRAAFSSSVKLFCGCGRVAVRRVAQTQANMGRAFFTCAINKDDYGCCGYFVWVDKLMEWLTNSTEEGIGTLGLQHGREIETQQRIDGDVTWKAEVNAKVDYMGLELKIIRLIVVGLFVMQLVSMMLIKT